MKQGEVDPVIKLYGGTAAAETLVSKVQKHVPYHGETADVSRIDSREPILL